MKGISLLQENFEKKGENNTDHSFININSLEFKCCSEIQRKATILLSNIEDKIICSDIKLGNILDNISPTKIDSFDIDISDINKVNEFLTIFGFNELNAEILTNNFLDLILPFLPRTNDYEKPIEYIKERLPSKLKSLGIWRKIGFKSGKYKKEELSPGN